MQKRIRATPKNKKRIPRNPKAASFPIAGIGGSAGGLEAFQGLLKNLSAKPEVALVFIMHLSPDHKSMLPELLGRVTKMPVHEIKNDMLLEVNHVYVIPPATDVSIASGKLILHNRKESDLKRMPIDCFFRSLAEEQGNRSIGVILSGTATDGTLGAEAIKAEGGIVFAQDEKSAKYPGMPQNAVSAGCVDFVFPLEKIARELERVAKHPLLSSAGFVKTDEPILTETKGLERIFELLRSVKKLDFTYYKRATVNRRISRRMVLLKLEKLEHYVKFLRGNTDELEKLYEDLLINVTSFFRDPKVFDALKKEVLQAILKNKTKDQAIRIWVPGCASGEEAYSIGICLIEALGNQADRVPMQIFATDVSENGVRKARRGIYGKNIKNDVTPKRLKRFFTKEGSSYKISKQLREMCIFSKQNVFGDPPFRDMDLISCRNLLIYLQPILQKTIFRKFHYALKPGGFLLLGNSEATGGSSDLFKVLDRKNKIFLKKYLPAELKFELDQPYSPPKELETKETKETRETRETDIAGIVDRIVLSEFAPCGALITGEMEVVQFRGHTGRYLESAAGSPSLHLSKLAREGLFLPIRTAVYQARKTKHTVKREVENVLVNGRSARVRITVVPVPASPAGGKSASLREEFFLVLFDEMGRATQSRNLPKAHGKISVKGKSVKQDELVNDLQKELAETKEYLQTVIEEQESANEEVKAANEEIMSSNEELQSTNEELETAKEELQSSNEELMTTNEELENRNEEVSLLNNDLVNLLTSINMPVVMMGTDLVIRRITPQCEKVLNVIPSDIGRPISKIRLSVHIPDLEEILLGVIKSLHPKTLEIKSREQNWYSVYIRPYRTMNNKIDGVVAIFVDITERKKAQQKIDEARAYAENIIKTMREPLIVLGPDLKVISANRAFYQTFKVNSQETEGRFIYDLGNRQWNIPKLRRLLQEILPKKATVDDYEVEHYFEGIGLKTMLLNARRLTTTTTKEVLLSIVDITERKRVEEQIIEGKKNLEKMNLELDSFVYTASHDLKAPLRAMSSFATFLEEDYQDKLDDNGRGHLNEIRKGADRMNKLIDDLLTLSRISRIQNPYEDVDINQLIQPVLERLKYDLEKFRVELQVQKNLPVVHCDRVKIAEAFVNLIGNAIKFSSKNTQAHPKIEVGYRTSAKDHEFYVRDNGIGIDPQYHEQIFDIFKRLHTAEEYEGTGTGLSIVKRVIGDHGGKVWLESELGKGATFYFTIPKTLEKKRKLGEILVDDKLITAEKLAEVLKKQGGQELSPPKYLGEV